MSLLLAVGGGDHLSDDGSAGDLGGGFADCPGRGAGPSICITGAANAGPLTALSHSLDCLFVGVVTFAHHLKVCYAMGSR